MKKLLSLVLVLVMVLGLSVTAFAGAGSGIFINGEGPVNSGQVTGNTAITAGTVTFTDSNPKKLTLNDATITSVASTAIISSTALEIELTGDNTVTGTQAVPAITVASGDLTFSGTGTLIAHGSGGDACPAIKVNSGTVTLPEGYKAVGSTSTTETVISNMSDATFSAENHTFMVGGTKAQTVAIIPASAPAEDGKSGTTTITATKAAPFSYEISIPSNVPEITAAGVYEVGQAKVTDVVSATDSTVISYIATTTNFKCNGKSDLSATYYTEQAATNNFPTVAVTVYANNADVASIPTMWVKIADTDWNAAAAGTYTATVTYNFTAEEAQAQPD